MDDWFQMVSSRSKCWPSISSISLIVAKKWTWTQKVNRSIIQSLKSETAKYQSLSDMDGWVRMVLSRGKCKPSPYICWEMDLNTITEPKSPRALMRTRTRTRIPTPELKAYTIKRKKKSMLPDRVSNPGPLTYESGALPIALRGPADTREEIGRQYSSEYRIGLFTRSSKENHTEYSKRKLSWRYRKR